MCIKKPSSAGFANQKEKSWINQIHAKELFTIYS
jgi:hypothetical protein